VANVRFSLVTDDPDLFVDQPVCIQVVGRPFEDEELISVTTVIDRLFKSA